MKKCIVVFSGGKESVFSLLEAKSQGYEIAKLLFLEKPGFSVHKVNIQAVKAVAQMLGYTLEVLRVSDEILEDKLLISYLERSREQGITALVTGNVKIEENHNTYAKLCEKVGLELVEPLYNRDTLKLLLKYIEIGLEFLIMGIRKNSLSLEWLGKTITRENFEEFPAEALSKGIDPCGEYGEYHTLVAGLKEIKVDLKPVKIEKSKNNMNYVLIDVLEKS